MEADGAADSTGLYLPHRARQLNGLGKENTALQPGERMAHCTGSWHQLALEGSKRATECRGVMYPGVPWRPEASELVAAAVDGEEPGIGLAGLEAEVMVAEVGEASSLNRSKLPLKCRENPITSDALQQEPGARALAA